MDMDIGALGYGEHKEMVIELKLDNTDQQKLAVLQCRGRCALNVMDQFVQVMELNVLAIDDTDFAYCEVG